MMAITEETVVAGIMTFFVYGVLPTLIILYVGGTGQRRKRREQQRQASMAAVSRQDNAEPAQAGEPESPAAIKTENEARERNDAS